MPELYDEKAFSQKWFVAKRKGTMCICSIAMPTEHRPRFAANPHWNHLIATMYEYEFIKPFSVFAFQANTKERNLKGIVLTFPFRSGLITTFLKSFCQEGVV